MRIPTDEEILRLHEKRAPTADALDLVYTHCLIVCGIVEQLHSRSATGRELCPRLLYSDGFLCVF